MSRGALKNQRMKTQIDPLIQYPSLRFLRDSLLVRDSEARAAGEGLITRVLLLATMNMRLPPDRLVTTQDAARLIGVDEDALHRLCYDAEIKPRYSLSKCTYWRSGDIYALVDAA